MKVLAEGKGDIMMCCLKEAREQSFELSLPWTSIRGTGISYKAGHPGVSQHKMTKPRV
jgi:hypothetical protein